MLTRYLVGCFIALAAGDMPARREALPVISSEPAFAEALARSPALLLFFYKRLDDTTGPDGRPQQAVEGGGATVQLATALASLASGPFAGLIAAVDCARTPRICAERSVAATPAFAFWRLGRFEPYAGALEAAAVAAYLERELAALASMEAAAAAPTTSSARLRAGLAGLGAYAWVLGAAAAGASGVRVEVLLAGGGAGALLCGIAALYVCGVRPERRRAARAAGRLRGASVPLEGGRVGWLVGAEGGAAGAAGVAALPALVLLGPSAPAEAVARDEQRTALQRVATCFAARGFRCLLLEASAPLPAAPDPAAAAAPAPRGASSKGGRGGGKGKAAAPAASAGSLHPAGPAACPPLSEADVGRVCEWMRARAIGADAEPAAARVGLIGFGEGGALVARVARRATSAQLLGCAVALDFAAPGADGQRGGSDALAAGCVAHVRALAQDARVPMQLHLDLAEGNLAVDDAHRTALAERLRAAVSPGGEVVASGQEGAVRVRLFLYGELAAAHDPIGVAADDHVDALAAPLPLLLQPDGRREVAKGYAWMRLAAFLHIHLAHR